MSKERSDSLRKHPAYTGTDSFWLRSFLNFSPFVKSDITPMWQITLRVHFIFLLGTQFPVISHQGGAGKLVLANGVWERYLTAAWIGSRSFPESVHSPPHSCVHSHRLRAERCLETLQPPATGSWSPVSCWEESFRFAAWSVPSTLDLVVSKRWTSAVSRHRDLRVLLLPLGNNQW